MLTPNPNEWNSTLTSEAKNIYPYLYLDLGKWVTGYELSMRNAPAEKAPWDISWRILNDIWSEYPTLTLCSNFWAN